MTNDYYDFNPSATTWALMLGVVVLFVVALSVVFIVMIARSQSMSTSRVADADGEPAGDEATHQSAGPEPVVKAAVTTS